MSETTYKDVFQYHVRQIVRSSANRWGGPMRSYVKAARVLAEKNLKDPAYLRTVRESYIRNGGVA